MHDQLDEVRTGSQLEAIAGAVGSDRGERQNFVEQGTQSIVRRLSDDFVRAHCLDITA